MSCPPRSCTCAITSETLDVVRTGDAYTVELPDAYGFAWPIFTFLDTAERDAELPSPQEGMECWTRTDNKKWRNTDGTVAGWRVIRQPKTTTNPTPTNVTLGTGGTSTLNYWINEDIVAFVYRLVLGTGGALTGQMSFPVPAGLGVGGGGLSRITGEAGLYDSDTTILYAGIWDLTAGGGDIQVYRADGGGTYPVTTASPFTWTVQDEIWAAGTIPRN